MKRIITLGIHCHQPQGQTEMKLTHPKYLYCLQLKRDSEPFFVGLENANWTQRVARFSLALLVLVAI